MSPKFTTPDGREITCDLRDDVRIPHDVEELETFAEMEITANFGAFSFGDEPLSFEYDPGTGPSIYRGRLRSSRIDLQECVVAVTFDADDVNVRRLTWREWWSRRVRASWQISEWIRSLPFLG